jgi:hypothetical protein
LKESGGGVVNEREIKKIEKKKLRWRRKVRNQKEVRERERERERSLKRCIERK